MSNPYKTPNPGRSRPREPGQAADRSRKAFWYGVFAVVLALAMMVASHAIYGQLSGGGEPGRIVVVAMDASAVVALIIGSILIVFGNR